ncbi:MAG: TetR/AcrR family transcriptional regulator [Steroidobacteraceae bacterium]
MKSANLLEAVRLPTPHLGRPRDERIDADVVSAVLDVLNSGGYRAVTIAAIAQRTKRGRSSIYRRWPSKRHLVAYSVVSTMGATPAADTGDLGRDLNAVVETLLRAFAGPLRQALPGLVADMANDPQLGEAIRKEVLAIRRRSMRQALARAVRRGEIRADFDVELILDMLTGPFYYRALFAHARISRRMAQEAVKYVLRALRHS